MSKGVEDLQLYKQYVTLISYTEMITKKYPKVEKTALVSKIKSETYDGLKCIILAYRLYDIKDKIRELNRLDSTLKTLKVLIRVSYKSKYINIKNYEAWNKKIFHIGNMLGGWINSCLKN